ncbi:MAG: O-antigen ligase family protein [Thiobacillaceae bacterium]
MLLHALLLTATFEGMLYTTIGGMNVRPYQLFLVLGLALALVRRSLALGGIGVLMGLYVLAGVPGLVNSIAPMDSLRMLFFAGLMVLIALTVRAFLSTSREGIEREMWFWVLGVGNIVNCFGLLQVATWAVGVPISPHFAPAYYPLYRPYSVFIEPNFYGNFLASQIAMLAVLGHTPGAWQRRKLIIPSAAVALGLLALNQSRGPWIATAMVLLLFVAARYLRRGMLPVRLSTAVVLTALTALVLLVVAALVSPTLTGAFVQRLRDTVNPLAEGAARDRLYEILLSIETFREHLWVGNGVGTWGYYIGREGRDVRTPPRNLVAAWFFEKGVVGAVIGFVVHLAIIGRTALALRRAMPELQLLIWTPFVGWLAVLITLQFTVLEISPFYWAVLGMLLAATDLSLSAPRARWRTATAMTLAPAASHQ